MPGIEWVATLDNKQFIDSMNAIQSSVKQAAALMGVTFGVHQLKQWGAEVMNIRGEFQKLEVAFNTMLGDAGKANALMEQLVKTAATTPFDLKSVAAGAKSLMAYGTAAEDVNNMLVRLGDIAAGMSIPLNDLVYLYGTTMVQGRMFTQDLRQFQGRGIPIADELAKVLNTTRDAIPELVTAGKVTSDVFHQAIMNMSDAGGKFGGLMEAQSKTITGQISNIQDAFDMMYNDIGKSSEGIINAVLSSVSYLVENYEKVGKVVLSLIAVYGEYKVAMLAANSIRKMEINALNTETEEKIIELKKQKLDEDLQEKVATDKLNLAQAQEIQGRREVLRSLEEEIAKRKEAKLAIISQQEAENTNTISTLENRIVNNNSVIQSHESEIADIDKRISQMTILGGKEAEIKALQEQRASLQQHTNTLLDDNLATEERIAHIEKENADLAKQSLDVKMRYGTDEEKTRLLQETINLRKEDLTLALEEADKLQQAADQETDAKRKETLATQAQEAAEKAENIQTEINTLEEEKNAIATNGNTVAKKGNTIATKTQATQLKIATLQQKINTVAQSEGMAVSKLFQISILQLGVAFNKLKLAIMTNPIGALVGVITLALPWIIEWIGGTDDATEAEKRYGNEASEAEAKIKSLTNTIKTADENSKVYKDSVTELERMYKEYGIEVEKVKDAHGNEIANVQALIERHGELVDVLRQEAIERQKYQDMDDAAKQFETKANEDTAKFKDRLDSDIFTASDKNAMVNLVDEDAVQRAGEELRKYQQILERLEETYGNNAHNQREAREQLAIYQQATNEAIDKAKAYAAATTDDADAVKEAGIELSAYISNLAEHKAEQIASNQAAEEAATKAWKVSDANAKLARDVRYAKMSTSELKEELRHLVQAYGDTTLNVRILFSEENVPNWIKGLDVDKLKSESEKWTTAIGNTPYGMITVDGKTYSREEATQMSAYLLGERERKEKAKAAADKEAQEAAEKAKKNAEKAKANAEKSANERAARNAKQLQDQWKHEQEMSDLQEKATRAREDASIAAIQNQAERERKEREAQHRRTIKDLKSQEDDIYKAIYDKRKRAYETANKGKQYENTAEGSQGWSKIDYASLTAEEKRYYDERNKIIESKLDEENAIYARYISERQKEQLQSMRDYIKEYGSVQEKIYAIEKEYDDKINEERDEYRKKSLKEEKKKALDTINVELLKTEIDWTMLFDGIGSALEDEMKATLDKVEKYMRTDSFKALDAKDKAEFVRMRNDLYSKTGAGVGTFNFSIYNQIAKDLDAYKTAIANHKQAVITHTEAVNRLSEIDKEVKDAEEKLKKAVSEEEKRKAETNLKYAQAKQKLQQNIVRGTKEQVTTTEGEVVVTKGNVEESSSKAIKALDNFGNALNQLNNGTLRGFADGLVNLINAIGGGKTNGLSGLGKVGGIIGAILSIIDALGDAPAQFFDDLFDKIATVLETVIAQIPQIAGSIIQGAGSVIGSVFTGVGDAVAGIFGGGEDWSAYDEAIDKWGGILDRWKDNVDYERELMEKAYGVKAIEASQKAVDAAKNAENAAKNIYIGWAGSGAGWFSHSNGYNVDNDVNWRLLYDYNQDLFNKVGEIQNEGHPWLERFTGDVTKLFDFTWQELEELKNRAPQFWESIHSTAQEYLEQYIEAGRTAVETQNALNEQLTTTTKENVFSDFLSSLYDLADGSEDVTKDIADNWQKMVNRMVIDNLIANEFQGHLKDWYEDLVKLQKERTREDNPIDDKEYQTRLNALKKQYDDYFNDAKGKVQTFTELGIIKPIEDAANKVSGLAEDMSDSIQSAFSDLMGDPTQDIEEWGNKLRNSLIQQFIRAQLLGSEFEEWANGIAERYNSAWEAYNGGGINEADLRGIMTNIDSEVDAYTEAISKKAKRLMEAFGYTPDTEETQSAFSGLRDTFLNTLTNIEGDAKAFRKNLEDIMVKDLIEKQVFDVPITVNGMAFDDFNAYVTDWNKRYSEAVKSGNQAAIDSLLDELVQVRELTVKAAEELRERLKVNDTTFSSMSDSWVSVLMDMTKTGEDWAENIGKTMAEKIIKEMLVTNAIQPLLDGLQDAFNTAMSQRNNGLIDFNNVLSAVAPELERIKAAYPGFQQVAKNIMDAFGLDTLTTQGFSNLSSSFFSALTDMEGDAAKFGKSIGVTMAEQMADEYINGKYGKQIDDANRRWREALEKGDTTAMDSIRSELESLYKTMADDSALKQFVDNIKQAQTEADTTFSDLADSWVSQLMDFNGTAEDWAENLGKMIAQKVIEQTVVGTMIQPLLDNLQNAVNNSLATFGNNYTAIMSDTSISDAVNALMANYPQIKELIESIMSAFGVHNIEENPFADLSNTLVSSLTDMNATAESFGREIGQTLVSQMIAAIVEQRGFQGQIDALGEQWSHALETGDVAAIERIKIQLVEIRRQMGEAVQPLLDSISDMEREADTTFSSMTDSWVSALSDMSKTAEDWAQDVGSVMAEKIISQMIAPKYIQPLLDEMQKTYNAVTATPGVSVAMAISSMTPYLERIKSVYAEIQPMVADIFGSFGIYQETIEETVEEVNYALQDMKSNFVSALMDMTNSTEDFSKDISKTLAQTFIEKFVLGDKFDQQMEYWQQQYESIIGSGMSEDERKKQLRALRDAIATAKEGYVNSAMAVQELLGLTAEDSQEATMNMADKITHDQADELLGINLAQELTLEQILAAITGNTSGIVPYSTPLSPAGNDMQAAQMIATIQGLTDLTRTSTENMLTQVAVANSHLQLIRDYSKTIRDEVVMHLASMDSKLTNLRNL